MAPSQRPPRVALAGIVLESNAFAPVATEDDFRARYYFEGEQIVREARAERSQIPREMAAFVQAMDASGPWCPIPTLLTGCQPWGPVDQSFFAASLDRILSCLEAAAPLDAVYVANHGAMVATVSHDPDGDMLRAIRKVVGPDCPVICTLDLHANVSKRMAHSALLVSYLTNPHVDQLERGEEAAHIVRSMLVGLSPKSYHVQLPLVPASVCLLTASGPYGELIDYGQRRARECGGRILNVSVTGNFAFSDCPDNGLAVTVTARYDAADARALAEELALRAWNMRERFTRALTPIDAAMAAAHAANRGEAPVIMSDAGDNPGGGGSGRTVELLEALLEANVERALFGSFFEPELAADAHRAGVGGEFSARFNREPLTAFDRPFEAPARVVALGDGEVVGRRGLIAGRAVSLGPSAALELEGRVTVVVISQRQQTADPVFFEMLGLDPGAWPVVCVKSRGHFRAGFDEWFSPNQVLEVDSEGLTSPVLSRFQWRRLPRPVYPLDPDTQWAGPVSA